MAVFWFGWAKKLKNVFTKQQADQYYLQKELPNQLQIVKGNVDFYKNVAVKQNGYVDRVDTNALNSMINKRYLEEQTLSKTTTTPQTIASQITFTQTNEVMKFNSGTNNSAYLSGYKSNNQRVWYFGKGSTTSDNFIIGADRGDIKLEPNGNVDVNNKKIVNVADPVNLQDAANKRYTLNSKKYTLFWQSNDRVFDNLATQEIPITYTDIDLTTPWILKYDRIVKNGAVYEGTFSFAFMIPDVNERIFSTNRWYFRASSSTFEEGSRVGIMILRRSDNGQNFGLKTQIWEGTKAIKNIRIYRPAQ